MTTDIDFAQCGALTHLPYAYGEPPSSGQIKVYPIDFKVDEDLGFTPEGEGEHVLLSIRKSNTNTNWVADELAKLANVKRHAVSFAGMKDRHGVTTQWFSIHLPGAPEPDWHALESDNIEIMAHTRHRRKLKRGSLRGNHFRLVIRECVGEQAVWTERLRRIQTGGVPNYFGTQRFGHQGNNLRQAQQLFAHPQRRIPRAKRSIYLSAARAFLFNQVLAERIQQQTWDRVIPGDRCMLAGSHSVFLAETLTDELEQRLAEFEISPTGPLCGCGEILVSRDAAKLEQTALAPYSEWTAGLCAAKLDAARRALRLPVVDLQWYFIAANTLELTFFLPKGGYATAMLRELLQLR